MARGKSSSGTFGGKSGKSRTGKRLSRKPLSRTPRSTKQVSTKKSATKPRTENPKSGGRRVDQRKTARVLAKLRQAKEAAGEDAPDGQGASSKLTAWEREFAQSVEAKLEKYGSAFRDASKGNLEEPLSARQAAKLREVVKAAQGKRKPMKRGGKGKTQWTPRVRRIEDD